MTIYYVDADQLESIERDMRTLRRDLENAMWPLEFGAAAVPWESGTQKLWSETKHIIKFEYGWLSNDADALRDRARRAREEAAKQAVLAGAPPWAVWAAWSGARWTECDGTAAPPEAQKKPAPTTEPPSPATSGDRHERVASFKRAFLGVRGVTWQPGPNGAIEGPHDRELDGECVSLVKRYIRWVDPDVKIPSISPSSPGSAYGSDWAKLTPDNGAAFKVQAGDIVYLNYGHVAVAITDQDASGKFEMIESNGWVRDRSHPNGGYVPSDSADSIVQMAPGGQNASRVTAIMRSK
jgi:hypothetical protein